MPKFKQIKELGVYSGADIRDRWKNDSTTIKKKMMDAPSMTGFKIEQVSIDNIDDIDKKVRIKLEGAITFAKETDVIFLDAYFEKIFDENPIKEVRDRKYPIEFDYLEQNNYKIYVLLNNQYEFDDYPTAKQITFGAQPQMYFKSTVDIDTTQNKILLQSKFENGSIVLPNTEIEKLRDFYNGVIKAQSQKIVLKKRRK
ncbi:hypothetical protein DBR32_04260 [Taibaiella sp. KBW10]|uniref:hypothetical protein n=1 Tax=Taibaiella sp. KBW10 TaxID=2153357 RepID=UPI000F5B3014|nr:hypothetical protein [Taibaiella sp. KBW10]RQO32021.1 hypothetical protein DBR32_04260 [Taibaiella sp. KBW10]